MGEDSQVSASPRAIELAGIAAAGASDKFARDIVAIDVSGQLAIADIFVIATGASDRQIRAIVDNIEAELRAAGEQPLRCEGARSGHWVLLDYFDIIVHVLDQETRSYYSLERLWKDCPLIQLPIEPQLLAHPIAGGAF